MNELGQTVPHYEVVRVSTPTPQCEYPDTQGGFDTAGFVLWALVAWCMVARTDMCTIIAARLGAVLATVLARLARTAANAALCVWFVVRNLAASWLPPLCALCAIAVLALALTRDLPASAAAAAEDFGLPLAWVRDAADAMAELAEDAWYVCAGLLERAYDGAAETLDDFGQGYGRDWYAQLGDVATGTNCYCSGQSPAC